MTEIDITITEGLKRLKLLEKRMVRNCEEIKRYSSLLSTEKAIFDTEEKQKKEVEKLIQSTLDLEKEYCRIKAAIDYTNLVIVVQIDDESRTIHSWLTVLRRSGNHILNTFKSLSTNEAQGRMNRFQDPGSQQTPQIIRLYDENEKRDGIRKWDDLISGKIIEGRLEVINATTKLQEPPM